MADAPPAARRTTAHNHKQLAEVLGWTITQVDKAVLLGVLPAYDLTTPRWKGATVDALAARRDELTAALDDGALLTADELMNLLELDWGDWRRGRDHGIIPSPDQRGGFWSRAAAQELAAGRCAELLAELTGLDVTDADVRQLHEQGHVEIVDYFKDWTLYDTAAVPSPWHPPVTGTAVAAAVVSERQAWLAGSITS